MCCVSVPANRKSNARRSSCPPPPRMVTLTSEQCTRLLAAFEAAASAKRAEGAEGPAEGAERCGGDGDGGTRRRGHLGTPSLRAQHVHAPWMAEQRRARARYPAHVVAFDVLFATAPGARVAWHCDYDSLGPFEVGDANAALRDDPSWQRPLWAHERGGHCCAPCRGGGSPTCTTGSSCASASSTPSTSTSTARAQMSCALGPHAHGPGRASATPSPTCASTPWHVRHDC